MKTAVETAAVIRKLTRDSILNLPRGTQVKLQDKYQEFETQFPETVLPKVKVQHAVRCAFWDARNQSIIQRTDKRGIWVRTTTV